MKTKKVTFSMSIELLAMLHASLRRRKASSFVTEAIQEKIDRELEALKAGYIAENNDPEAQQIIRDWLSLS